MLARTLLLAATLALTAGNADAAPQAECAMEPADRAWLDGALAAWRASERGILKLAPSPLPTIVAIDARCTYVGRAGAGGAVAWAASTHSADSATLPDGQHVPIGPISFAAPDIGAVATGYFAMSLPSVWRAAGIDSPIGLERLMQGVLLHELMHTRQFYFANPTLAAVTAKYGLGDDIDDDSLQARFEKDPAYVAAYQAERDLLFAAAAAPDQAEARRLAGRALDMMRARRTRWFTGDEAEWAPLDDIFLTMEGLGQWLAYAWYVSPEGAGITPATALPAVRRNGKRWSQDQGLALFLVIDRLVPDWQKLAFAERPDLAEALLARAAGEAAR